ncbi:MAG: NAD+ synthase [Actinomycetota bacterium]|nr:NAD+ synthase [Actinomycetota bacterium]
MNKPSNPKSLRVGLCQINPIVGDISGNVEKIVDAILDVQRGGAQVAVLPELAISGYPPEDLLLKPAFIRECSKALEEVAARTPGVCSIVGYPEGDRSLHNSAAIINGGKVASVYRKRLLPNYGVFDELRYFTPGDDEVEIFQLGDIRFGVSICEDIWSPSGPCAIAASKGAEVIFNLNASPYSVGRQWDRFLMLATRSSDFSIPIVYTNLVGGQDELVFDGGSMVFGSDGKLIASLESFNCANAVVELNLERQIRDHQLDPRGTKKTSPSSVIEVGPMPSNDSKPKVAPLEDEFIFHPNISSNQHWLEQLDSFHLSQILKALTLGLSDYVSKNGFSSVVIGLSGGIDSALCAAICSIALGPSNVTGIAMPSIYNPESSQSDAKELANNLGINYHVMPIVEIHESIRRSLAPVLNGPPKGLTDENLQSRIRGLSLMAFSNATGALLVATGNKSEVATGYSTLYGDSAGGFALIKDLPKLLVYKISNFINEVHFQSEVIPESIIQKAPSAELRLDQKDEDSLPPYEILDPIVIGLIEMDLAPTDLSDNDEVVEETAVRVANLIDRNEYKRRQSAPGVRITPRAFGKDRRMPITNQFRPG